MGAETPRSTASAGGGIPEARKKDVRLRDRFQLPESESCIEHFSCAYSNKILRQGHIYVMLRHVCFHSSVYSTVLTIPTTEIEAVLPKNNLFFPNSIEIVQTNGTKHFFTSFLSRERCLDLIKSRWQTEIARATETEAIPALAGRQNSLSSPAPAAPHGTSPRTLEAMRRSEGSVSIRRKGWPMSSETSQDPNTFTEEGWTNILELTLQGWDVTDVLTIFENNDTFITDWHNSLGDTDVSSTEWALEDGDRKRQVNFTARIHDPPMGSGKFAKCVQVQKARMHGDGSFTLDSSQQMPQLTIASFRVEAYWRLVQLAGRTQVTVHLRVRFLKFSMLKATITSQSTSQAISCFAALKQRLSLRFPSQGTAADCFAIANDASHAAADVDFALRIAKDAALRMPRTWQDHLLASLSEGQPALPNPFSELAHWFTAACKMALVALTVALLLAPRLSPDNPPPHHLPQSTPGGLAFLGDHRGPAAYQLLLQGCDNGTCTVNESTIAAFSAMGGPDGASDPHSTTDDAQAEDVQPTPRGGMFSWLLGSSAAVPAGTQAPDASVNVPEVGKPSSKEQKASVAATDLDAIDLEGGIEALLFLLEAAKKTKQRGGDADEPTGGGEAASGVITEDVAA